MKKKENLPNCRVCCPGWHRVKLKESTKKDKYQDLASELKKLRRESDGDNNCKWCSWHCHQKIGTRTGGLGNKRANGDHPNYSIIEIDQNTEKSLGYLRRFAVSQTPVRNHLLTVWWKIREGENNYNNRL